MTDQALSNKSNNKTKFDSKKIIIETKADLYNLPINLLKSTNILDFSGKYFDFIYNCALDFGKYNEHKNSISSNQSTKLKKLNLPKTQNIPRNVTENNIRPKKKLAKKGLKSAKKARATKTNMKINTQNEDLNQNIESFQEKNSNPIYNDFISKTETNTPSQTLNLNHNNYQNTNTNTNTNTSINSKNNYYNDDYMDYYNDNYMDVNNILSTPYQKNKYQSNIVSDSNEFKINKISFEMKYNTRIGENLGIIGSIPELGGWKESKALKMTWHNDNIWKASLFYNSAVAEIFEFKFIFLCDGVVKQWEDGTNRKFSLTNIKKLMESSLKNGNGAVTLRAVSGCDLIYDPKDNELNIRCSWNKK